ncbi:hypothetical protein F2981_28645 (plasmid) [Sinorhizobium meliloti]|nr:hypothetical protein [Sinorhizobium meliloti]
MTWSTPKVSWKAIEKRGDDAAYQQAVEQGLKKKIQWQTVRQSKKSATCFWRECELTPAV